MLHLLLQATTCVLERNNSSRTFVNAPRCLAGLQISPKDSEGLFTAYFFGSKFMLDPMLLLLSEIPHISQDVPNINANIPDVFIPETGIK